MKQWYELGGLRQQIDKFEYFPEPQSSEPQTPNLRLRTLANLTPTQVQS
jgi:hypothetical protein